MDKLLLVKCWIPVLYHLLQGVRGRKGPPGPSGDKGELVSINGQSLLMEMRLLMLDLYMFPTLNHPMLMMCVVSPIFHLKYQFPICTEID